MLSSVARNPYICLQCRSHLLRTSPRTQHSPLRVTPTSLTLHRTFIANTKKTDYIIENIHVPRPPPTVRRQDKEKENYIIDSYSSTSFSDILGVLVLSVSSSEGSTSSWRWTLKRSCSLYLAVFLSL